MNRLRDVLARIRAIGRRRELDRDLDEQIAAHLDEAVEERERQGLSREEARRAALRSFGGLVQVQEAHREVRSFLWLEEVRRDTRHALRTLRRAPGFTAAAILTLGLRQGRRRQSSV